MREYEHKKEKEIEDIEKEIPHSELQKNTLIKNTII